MENFDDLMSEALDDAIKMVLGESASKLIHSLTEKQLSAKIKQSSNNIETIITYLEKLIGKEGAQIIQTASIKRLCQKLKEEYENVEAHFVFLDELYEMKFKLLAPTQNEKNKQSGYN
ncbi:MAG: hypothetical protein NWF06_11335 [Candidatus Bathyarchaeota archaeon]|nr:hypothetical protein [Candidatus Bathyarchaeum sp.]